MVVYGRLAGRLFWGASMLAGWLAFAARDGAVQRASRSPRPAALALAVAGARGRPRGAAAPAARCRLPGDPLPTWDLPLRAACALALVLTLTAIAGWLGPQLSGLLAPFPIIATVLATFTHAQRGVDETLRLLRGLVSGFGAFALFCFTLAVSLRSLGIAGGLRCSRPPSRCSRRRWSFARHAPSGRGARRAPARRGRTRARRRARALIRRRASPLWRTRSRASA